MTWDGVKLRSWSFLIGHKLRVNHEGGLDFFGCIDKTNHKKRTLLKNLCFNQLSVESGLVRFWLGFFNDINF